MDRDDSGDALADPQLAVRELEGPDLTPEDLLAAVREIDRHVATQGWDQPTLLFALVPTAIVRASNPALAEQLGLDPDGLGDPALLTFEQQPPTPELALDDFLAGITWPDDVTAAAVVVERIVLPPSAEAGLGGAADPVAAAREHPDRQDVRMTVAADRHGQRMCALRLRGADTEAEVRTGVDLVPGLADALAATFHS